MVNRTQSADLPSWLAGISEPRFFDRIVFAVMTVACVAVGLFPFYAFWFFG
jgi:hypothetical protein